MAKKKIVPQEILDQALALGIAETSRRTGYSKKIISSRLEEMGTKAPKIRKVSGRFTEELLSFAVDNGVKMAADTFKVSESYLYKELRRRNIKLPKAYTLPKNPQREFHIEVIRYAMKTNVIRASVRYKLKRKAVWRIIAHYRKVLLQLRDVEKYLLGNLMDDLFQEDLFQEDLPQELSMFDQSQHALDSQVH